MNMIINSEQLKQYFLGNVSDKIAEKIDLKIISDEDFEVELMIAEESLIEEFLDGQLSEKETELFYKNFLITDERKNQVKTISQLKDFARKSENKNPIIETNETELNFFQSLSKFFALNTVKAGFAVLIVGLTISLVWFGFFRSDNQTPLETEYAKINNDDFRDSSKYEDYQRLNLVSGNTRSIGKTNELFREKLSDKIFFNLALRTDSNDPQTFDVQIIKDKNIIFTLKKLKVYKNEFGQELRFFLPAKILELGNYQISVNQNNKENSRMIYSFTVK